MFRRFPWALIIVVVAMIMLSQSAFALIRNNTIDPDATLFANGRQALVSGPIACDRGDHLRIQITVTQASTGAWGTGHSQVRCTGEVQEWTVRVIARGPITFGPGHADATAEGITRFRGSTTDSHVWSAADGITLH